MAARPVDCVGLPPDISITISPATSFFFIKFLARIYRIGIFPLFPKQISGISVPLMQYTLSVLFPKQVFFPQSPLIISSIKFEKVPDCHVLLSGLSINHFLKSICTCCSKLSFMSVMEVLMTLTEDFEPIRAPITNNEIRNYFPERMMQLPMNQRRKTIEEE